MLTTKTLAGLGHAEDDLSLWLDPMFCCVYNLQAHIFGNSSFNECIAQGVTTYI